VTRSVHAWRRCRYTIQAFWRRHVDVVGSRQIHRDREHACRADGAVRGPRSAQRDERGQEYKSLGAQKSQRIPGQDPSTDAGVVSDCRRSMWLTVQLENARTSLKTTRCVRKYARHRRQRLVPRAAGRIEEKHIRAAVTVEIGDADRPARRRR
jgi:hypothetical protein